MRLFRRQAIDYQRRLHGDVFLVPPVRWQLIGYLLGAMILAALTFLALGSYGRSITGAGMIRPSGGVADISIPADGILSAILVPDGASVHRGQVIARISIDHHAQGQSLADARNRTVSDQVDAIRRQSSAARSDADESRRKLEDSIADEQRQIEALESQIQAQQALIRSSQEELARLSHVADKGFISGYDMQKRRELLVTRQQGLAELLQARSSHQRALAVARTELSQLPQHLAGTLGDYEAQMAEARRDGATLDTVSSVDLIAGRDGVLTAVLGHVGDSVRQGENYGRIVPPHAAYEAELRVPSSTISQIAPGQDVRVALPSYPIAEYGVLRGVITHVSSAPTEGADSAFLVTAKLDPLTPRQTRRGILLRPGLAASGRIILDRRSFLQWIIDPLGSITRR